MNGDAVYTGVSTRQIVARTEISTFAFKNNNIDVDQINGKTIVRFSSVEADLPLYLTA